MHAARHRRLCAVLGAGLLVLVAGLLVVFGAALRRSPPLALQAGLLTLAGVLDVAAAGDTTLVSWYRLSGLANVALGLALPVGLLGWSGEGAWFLFAVTAVGGLALAGVGVDLLAYGGRHVYEHPPGADDAGA